MNAIAISVGSITVYWSSLIIALGVLAGLVMGLSLCRDDKCRASAVLCFYPPAILFSVFFSRLIHWYSYMEQYTSFVAAVTDYSAGGYCVSGVVLGVLLAGAVVRWAGLVGRIGSLFDTVLPGVVLSVAVLRLSESFGNICRSKISVTYKFATFFVSFLLLELLSLVLVRLCVHRRDVPMLRGMSRTGNVARLGLVLFAAIEIVLDSTRSDPVSIHFAFLTMFNKYVGFISVTMFVCAVCILCVFLRYFKAVKRNGTGRPAPLLAGYIVSLVGIGASEYLVQRFTGMFMLYRSIQTLSAALMVFVVCRCYALCCDEPWDGE